MSTQIIDFNNVENVVFDGQEVETLKLNDIVVWEGFKKLGQLIDRSIESISAEDLEGVTKIPDYAFARCYSLTSLELPSTITSISGSYGINTTRIVTLRLLSTIPPTLSMPLVVPSTLTRIEVPSSSLSDYKNATNWSNYSDIMVGV